MHVFFKPHKIPNLKAPSIFLSLFLCLLFCSFTYSVVAQQSYRFKEERAAEEYSFLKDSTNLTWLEAIKYLSLSAKKNSYLSIGGSYRPRFEYFSNKNWIADNNENYYSQRISLHTDWHFGKYLRFFGELYHGYKTDGPTFLQTDDLDWHQGFVAINLPLDNSQFSIRFGRQEMKLGAGRLVDLRVGPNLRRAFDMGRATFRYDKFSVDAFYGKEVSINFDAFDNTFSLFNAAAVNPKLWGVYGQLPIRKDKAVHHTVELYYLGFQSGASAYNDVAGKEIRHSIGGRSFGSANQRFQYNTEFIYQFGDLSENSISAFNFETDWKYIFIHKKWRPIIGLKFDWSSGDKGVEDGQLNSFNPLFVNPGIYSLAAVNTPVNLLSVHPSFIIFPNNKWMFNFEFATFFRSSVNDGLYAPPRFQIRPAAGISDRHIGNTIGLFLKYTHNRYITFDIRSSYFIAGDFVKTSGASEDIFQFTSTLSLLF